MRQQKDIYLNFKAAAILCKPKIYNVAVCWPLVKVTNPAKTKAVDVKPAFMLCWNSNLLN